MIDRLFNKLLKLFNKRIIITPAHYRDIYSDQDILEIEHNSSSSSKILTPSLIAKLKSEFRLDWRGIHGVTHWARVRRNGIKLAAITGANINVIELFAFLHDSQRISDNYDPDHGKRAAQFAALLQGDLFQISDQELQLLMQACQFHSDGLIEADITVQTCWDADRLDLGRLNIMPEAQYLCTSTAKDTAMIKWAFEHSQRHSRPDQKNI